MRTTFDIKFTALAGNEGRFAGYASAFGPPGDAYGRTVRRGAFAASLAAHRQAGTTPAMLWSHDAMNPIGTWQTIEEDEYGLRVEGALTLEVGQAREVAALLRDRAVTGMSIGGFGKVEETDDGVELVAMDLQEISLCFFPANKRARVVEVRSMAPAELERVLRAGGFSKADARALMAGGYRALKSDSDDAAAAALVRQIEAATAKLKEI